jgi:prepilin-type N-terminal cleavage/methylation domain-containing protein
MIGGTRTKRRAGFTLLEVLVVTGLLGVVTTLGLSAFVAVTSAWNERQIQQRLDEIASDVFEAMDRDISNMLSAHLTGDPLRGVSEEYRIPGSNPPAYTANDKLVLVLQGAQSPSPLYYTHRAQYAIDRSSAPARLVRFEGPVGDTNPQRAASPLTPPSEAGIAGLRIQYAAPDGNEWLNEWSRSDNPSAIRVSIALRSLVRPDIQVSRVRVFPVHVQ